MGLLKKIGKAVKKGVKGVAKLASKAAPLVALVPGVGTLGGAALGAGGALLAGEGLGTAARRGALGAAGGLAGGAARKLIGRPRAAPPGLDMTAIGNQAVADADGGLADAGLAQGMANTMRNSPAISGGYEPTLRGLGGSAPSASPSTGGRSLLSRVGGAVGSVAKGVGRFALDNPMLLAQGGLAALGTVQGAQQQGEADAMRRRALEGVMDEPEPGAGTLDGYTDPTNPYAMRGAGAMNPAQRSARRALSGY